MTKCVLSAVIVIILANNSCAAVQTNQNNLITTYDLGATSSENPISVHLLGYRQISVDDQPDHPSEQRRRVWFGDQTANRPIKFGDSSEYTGTDAPNQESNVSFRDDEHYDQFDLNTFQGESDIDTSGNKIHFEGNNDESIRSDYQEINADNDKTQVKSNRVVFKDGVNHGVRDFDNSLTQEQPVDNSIKFENNDDTANSFTKPSNAGRNPVTERITFVDDSNKNQEEIWTKKRKPRKSFRFQKLSGTIAPNSSHPSLGYPGNLGLENLNSDYTGYPIRGYPAPSYTYPYQKMKYPTTSYPEYSPYPGPLYPPISSGYGLYTNSGTREPRPPIYPVEQSGHTDTRYPSQEHAGSVDPVTTNDGIYYHDYLVSGHPQSSHGDPSLQYPVQSQPQYRPQYSAAHQPGYQSGYYRPSRRPKSLTQRAISAVAGALTSIAKYDDAQCVPRLLCEVAGGSAVSSSTLLKATAGLQPLLTVLQSYSSESTSPLFVFSRAAVTGMLSRGNPSVCRYAYPRCPKEPDQLINYLNNHNGGFFRFFGQPVVAQQPQNLEQFYNYLSGQNEFQQQPQQNSKYPSQGYGLQPQNQQHNYHKQKSSTNAKNIEIKIEERIQNKPGANLLEDENDLDAIDVEKNGSKWLFPDEVNTKHGNDRDKVNIITQPLRSTRTSKTLIFPDDNGPTHERREINKPRDYVRKQKSVLFPGQNNLHLGSTYQTTTSINSEEYVFDYKHNFYVKRPKAENNDDVVYIVRGNGDPNHPEVVKVRPGQTAS